MATPSLLALRLFESVFLPWMRQRVQVRIAGLPAELTPDLPLLVVANHVSWWDGFVLREIHRELRPHAPLRVVMNERELRRNRVLGWIAAVPMQPGSPASVLGTFRRLRALRGEHPDTVVLFFPQGRIWPSQRRPLGFARGVATLARTLSPVQVLPVGLHMEPLAGLRPTMFAAAAAPIRLARGARLDPRLLETAVAAQLDAIAGRIAHHGERADREWPKRYDALPSVMDRPKGVHPLRPHLRILPGDGRDRPGRRKG